jgi:hypothetical protein
MAPNETMACPACGGSGGGPFGRAGTGWDVETYECVRCAGAGVVSVREEERRAAAIVKPGVAKAREQQREQEKKAATKG